ncbi:MAG: hypothetical protein ACKO1U_09930 [Bacteroidota bacterium]
MNKNFLFAIDKKTEEVMVSVSPKGSNQITFIEKIRRQDDPILYDAVLTLTGIAQAPNPDAAIFKSMDKVCQLLYAKRNDYV